ncbi:hypothetical protein VaNZ11_014125, partial [Volvox africanus]
MEVAAGQLRLDQVFPLPVTDEIPNERCDQTNILTSLHDIYLSGKSAQARRVGVAGPGRVAEAQTAAPASDLREDLGALLQATYQQLTAYSGRDWPQQSTPTSSVSYIVASESTQEGTAGCYEPLPHVTIRPPGLVDRRGPQADVVADVMLRGTAVAIMPWRCDHTVREYLLQGHRRRALLAATGGVLYGAKALHDLRHEFRERVLVVLHFYWDGAQLSPCDAQLPPQPSQPPQPPRQQQQQQPLDPSLDQPLFQQRPLQGASQARQSGGQVARPEQLPPSSVEAVVRGKPAREQPSPIVAVTRVTEAETATADPAAAVSATRDSAPPGCLAGALPYRSIEESNVQLGVLVRKGVGGTYAFQAAHKALEAHGLLPLARHRPGAHRAANNMTAIRPYAFLGASPSASQGALASLLGVLSSSGAGDAVSGAAVAAAAAATTTNPNPNTNTNFIINTAAAANDAVSSSPAVGVRSALAAAVTSAPIMTPRGDAAAAAEAEATGASAPARAATHAPVMAMGTRTRTAAPPVLAAQSAVSAADRPMAVRASVGSLGGGLMSTAATRTRTDAEDAAQDVTMEVTGDTIDELLSAKLDDPHITQPTGSHLVYGSILLPQQLAEVDAAGAVPLSQPLVIASSCAASPQGFGNAEEASVPRGHSISSPDGVTSGAHGSCAALASGCPVAVSDDTGSGQGFTKETTSSESRDGFKDPRLAAMGSPGHSPAITVLTGRENPPLTHGSVIVPNIREVPLAEEAARTPAVHPKSDCTLFPATGSDLRSHPGAYRASPSVTEPLPPRRPQPYSVPLVTPAFPARKHIPHAAISTSLCQWRRSMAAYAMSAATAAVSAASGVRPSAASTAPGQTTGFSAARPSHQQTSAVKAPMLVAVSAGGPAPQQNAVDEPAGVEADVAANPKGEGGYSGGAAMAGLAALVPKHRPNSSSSSGRGGAGCGVVLHLVNLPHPLPAGIPIAALSEATPCTGAAATVTAAAAAAAAAAVTPCTTMAPHPEVQGKNAKVPDVHEVVRGRGVAESIKGAMRPTDSGTGDPAGRQMRIEEGEGAKADLDTAAAEADKRASDLHMKAAAGCQLVDADLEAKVGMEAQTCRTVDADVDMMDVEEIPVADAETEAETEVEAEAEVEADGAMDLDDSDGDEGVRGAMDLGDPGGDRDDDYKLGMEVVIAVDPAEPTPHVEREGGGDGEATETAGGNGRGGREQDAAILGGHPAQVQLGTRGQLLTTSDNSIRASVGTHHHHHQHQQQQQLQQQQQQQQGAQLPTAEPNRGHAIPSQGYSSHRFGTPSWAFPGAGGGGIVARRGGAIGKPLKLYSYCCRLELYVDERLWRRTNKPGRDLLFSAVRAVERRLHDSFNEWNHESVVRHCAGLLERVRTGAANVGEATLPAIMRSSAGCGSWSLPPTTTVPLPAPSLQQQQQQQQQLLMQLAACQYVLVGALTAGQQLPRAAVAAPLDELRSSGDHQRCPRTSFQATASTSGGGTSAADGISTGGCVATVGAAAARAPCRTPAEAAEGGASHRTSHLPTAPPLVPTAPDVLTTQPAAPLLTGGGRSPRPPFGAPASPPAPPAPPPAPSAPPPAPPPPPASPLPILLTPSHHPHRQCVSLLSSSPLTPLLLAPTTPPPGLNAFAGSPWTASASSHPPGGTAPPSTTTADPSFDYPHTPWAATRLEDKAQGKPQLPVLSVTEASHEAHEGRSMVLEPCQDDDAHHVASSAAAELRGPGATPATPAAAATPLLPHLRLQGRVVEPLSGLHPHDAALAPAAMTRAGAPPQETPQPCSAGTCELPVFPHPTSAYHNNNQQGQKPQPEVTPRQPQQPSQSGSQQQQSTMQQQQLLVVQRLALLLQAAAAAATARSPQPPGATLPCAPPPPQQQLLLQPIPLPKMPAAASVSAATGVRFPTPAPGAAVAAAAAAAGGHRSDIPAAAAPAAAAPAAAGGSTNKISINATSVAPSPPRPRPPSLVAPTAVSHHQLLRALLSTAAASSSSTLPSRASANPVPGGIPAPSFQTPLRVRNTPGSCAHVHIPGGLPALVVMAAALSARISEGGGRSPPPAQLPLPPPEPTQADACQGHRGATAAHCHSPAPVTPTQLPPSPVPARAPALAPSEPTLQVPSGAGLLAASESWTAVAKEGAAGAAGEQGNAAAAGGSNSGALPPSGDEGKPDKAGHTQSGSSSALRTGASTVRTGIAAPGATTDRGLIPAAASNLGSPAGALVPTTATASVAAAAAAAAAELAAAPMAAAATAAATPSAVIVPGPFPCPLYMIGTRDSFTYHLQQMSTVVRSPDGRTFRRTEYFFHEDELPPDYWLFAGKPKAEFFTNATTHGSDNLSEEQQLSAATAVVRAAPASGPDQHQGRQGHPAAAAAAATAMATAVATPSSADNSAAACVSNCRALAAPVTPPSLSPSSIPAAPTIRLPRGLPAQTKQGAALVPNLNPDYLELRSHRCPDGGLVSAADVTAAAEATAPEPAGNANAVDGMEVDGGKASTICRDGADGTGPQAVDRIADGAEDIRCGVVAQEESRDGDDKGDDEIAALEAIADVMEAVMGAVDDGVADVSIRGVGGEDGGGANSVPNAGEGNSDVGLSNGGHSDSRRRVGTEQAGSGSGSGRG